ncbi:MAG: PKD domain-containing protein [Bacteroidales bacterium]
MIKKIYSKPRISAIIICLLFLSSLVFSQETIDAYKVEADGYFIHQVNTTAGVIATDNFASKIYLIQNHELKDLITSPGCGRYFTVSPDKTNIGFKLIKPDGMQVPAVFDLQTMKITELSNPADLCGQVSFSDDGKIAYTIGNEWYAIKNNITKTYNLGVYSNIAPISPDGNFAIFNNDKDQLFILDISTNQIIQITDGLTGYVYPNWSPDGSKVLYSKLSRGLMIWDKTNNKTYSIGSGENASWSDDSQYIIFDRTTVENFEFKGSDIYIAKSDGSKIINLTNTSGINEIYPSFGPNNSIVYSTFEKKEIVSATFDPVNFQIVNKNTLVKINLPLSINNNFTGNFSKKKSKAITMVQGDVPYVHQVYDTPDWHSGYWSCAPTTAIMALAYYNRLPYWDITCSSPSSHTNHYGSYVADMYRYNEIYYNTSANDYAGNPAYGGYGYMWGLGSPNSYMATYIQNHDVTSVHSTSTTFADVQNEINNSYPFSICSTITSAGHLTLAVGYVNGQNTLIFNDPYGNKNNGYMNYSGKNSYYDWPGNNNGYQNLNTVAWTVTAEATQLTYNDTIIDDVYYNHGFYMYNQTPSHMKYFRDGETGGYGNFSHYWYTYTSSSTTTDTCYVTWTPTLPTAGDYEVSVYIPTTNASATTARYKVFYNGGSQTVSINQAPIYGAWVSLGTFPFLAGTSGYVRLGDGTGTAGQKIAFDAMKWENVTQPAAIASFNSSATSVCEENSVQFTNTSSNATSYSWTFNGGTPATSTQTSPLIQYLNSGVYTVSLIATGPGGSNTLTMTNYITVNSAATAGFSASDTLVYLPSASIIFTNSSSDATSYHWDFGDGITSVLQSPNHTYSTSGDYTVTLIAYNSQCGNDTTTIIIHVLNPAPVAGFGATSTTVCEGDSVQFTSTSVNATNYNWSFTGGSPASSTLSNPSVIYAGAGIYTVELIVTGPGGIDTLNIQNYITVNPLPVAAFTANDTLIYLPVANATFINNSTNASSYLWDFGDGQTSTDFQPWHSYSSQGYYNVILIAHNNLCGNDTLVISNYIHVEDVTNVNEGNTEVAGFSAYPNPAGDYFTISYELKKQGTTEIKMFDMLGNEILLMPQTNQSAGKYNHIINKNQLKLSSGIYTLKLYFEGIAGQTKFIKI